MTVTIDDPLNGGSDPGAWADAMRWLEPFLTAPVVVAAPARVENGSAGVDDASFHKAGLADE